MFKVKQRNRKKLFKRAMLTRKEQPARRRIMPGEAGRSLWVSVSLWIAFLLVGGYILFFSPALMVQRVSIEGESVIPLEEYEDLIEASLEGAYFGILQKRNYFLVPTREIATRVLEHYPLLSGATVKRHFPDTLVLLLREDPAILLWCSNGPCYRVQNGRAISAPYSEDDRYVSSRLSVIDESALSVQLGAALPVEPYLETFRAIRDGLSRLTVGGVSVSATTPSRHSNELALSISEGWRLLVAVDRPAEESLGVLRVFLDEYGKERPDRSKLDSLDLRVAGKVFYAESGQPLEEAKPIESEPATHPDKEDDAKKKRKSGR